MTPQDCKMDPEIKIMSRLSPRNLDILRGFWYPRMGLVPIISFLSRQTKEGRLIGLQLQVKMFRTSSKHISPIWSSHPEGVSANGNKTNVLQAFVSGGEEVPDVCHLCHFCVTPLLISLSAQSLFTSLSLSNKHKCDYANFFRTIQEKFVLKPNNPKEKLKEKLYKQTE